MSTYKRYLFEGQQCTMKEIRAIVPVMCAQAILRALEQGRDTRIAMLAFDHRAASQAANRRALAKKGPHPLRKFVEGGTSMRTSAKAAASSGEKALFAPEKPSPRPPAMSDQSLCPRCNTPLTDDSVWARIGRKLLEVCARCPEPAK